MMQIAHLVVVMVDSTSETWCRLVNDTSGHPTVLYRSKFGAALAEISYTFHLGPWAPLGHMRVMCLWALWKLVWWVKTEVNLSAVKHASLLSGPICEPDGLGLAHTRLIDHF